MSAKGSAIDCCCFGCATPPSQNLAGSQGDSQDPAAQPLQLFCINCAPVQICLSVTVGGKIYPALLTRIDGGCDPYHGQTYYSGYIPLGTNYLPAELNFFVDEYDQCWFVLSMGAESASLLITDAVRAELNQSCQNCAYTAVARGNLVWNFSSGVSIVGSVPFNVSLISQDDCPGCPPCELPYGQNAPASLGCGVNCLGCSCICGVACITVARNGQVVESGGVEICQFTYVSGGGTVISIQPDPYTGNCSLVVEHVGGGTGGLTPTTPAAQQLGIGSAACPDPFVQWAFTEIATGDSILVTFSASECGVSCEELASVPCCPEALPRLLHVEIDGTGCGCGTIVIPVFENTITGHSTWTGSTAPYVWCYPGDPGRTVQLILSCTSRNQWNLQIKMTGDTQYFSYDNTGGGCSPMNLVFGDIDPHGIGDCRPPYFYSPPPPLIATVTE